MGKRFILIMCSWCMMVVKTCSQTLWSSAQLKDGSGPLFPPRLMRLMILVSTRGMNSIRQWIRPILWPSVWTTQSQKLQAPSPNENLGLNDATSAGENYLIFSNFSTDHTYYRGGCCSLWRLFSVWLFWTWSDEYYSYWDVLCVQVR